PAKRQVIQVPNTFIGLSWLPDGKSFAVAGGVNDNVHLFTASGDRFEELQPPITLGHKAGLGIDILPVAAGLASDPEGRRLLVANYSNDSVTLVDLEKRSAVAELDLRPGKNDPAKSGVAGGEYPLAVVWQSASKAYVTSQRDREIVILAIDGERMRVARRIKTKGQPNQMILNRAGDRLYVACDNSDSIAVIDTARDALEADIPAVAPQAVFANAEGLRGANPNNLALSLDERTLFVSNGGLNAVAVVQLEAGELGASAGAAPARTKSDDDGDSGVPVRQSRVIGLIPTGWYPNAVALGSGGRTLFVVNGKSDPGPNPGACRNTYDSSPPALAGCYSQNQYVWQLEKAGFLTMPVPNAATLARLTWQVAANDNFPAARRFDAHAELLGFLKSRIRHVIYVIKENRTYDQVLGDLDIGDGDPRLALMAGPISPNHHRLARQFVTLDHFFDSGESSNVGWNWTTAARATDYVEKNAPVNYARRGLQYDLEGTNRNINVGLPTLAERKAVVPATPDDPDVMPGTADVAAPDAPLGVAGAGYLWDAALRAGLTLRNYGFYGDLLTYDPKQPGYVPPLREPFKEGRKVFVPTKQSLAPVTDPYFRGFDMRYADFWRIREWEREFDEYERRNDLPNLVLVRLPHDHTGSFNDAADGVNTVETQWADNDYALGRLVERVASSPFRDDTLIFVVEDDAQDGADHVDAHRSIAFVLGPYVKQGALVTHGYTTVNMLRTIEGVLGIPPLGLNDGLAEPMAEVFDRSVTKWSYTALVPEVLRTTALPLPPKNGSQRGDADPLDGCFARPKRSAAYWARAMRGQNFDQEDQLDVARYNLALWAGLKGDSEPPPYRHGRDLSQARAALLTAWRAELRCAN
ncbi:MAG TPA: hypothetical protein VEU47_05260, partial [Candidatus Cybelea sp.]|nr:hypothetical protein [Candidatus Cybelea sp.]